MKPSERHNNRSASPRPRMRWLRLAAYAVAASVVLAACGSSNEGATSTTTDDTLSGVVRDPAPYVGSLSLPRVDDGSAMALRASPGKILVLYFGYTSCPDVCPTTLADFSNALKKMDHDPADVELAMATIDPVRDQGAGFESYVESFVPNGVALRANDDAELAKVADALGVSYSVDMTDPANPEVAHSGYLYAIDDRGALLVQWAFGTTSADMAHDLDLLLSAGTDADADTTTSQPSPTERPAQNTANP